ncbi:hypothetical protein HDV57DRAFT_517919 [Trichoderma longibrachiatum]
MSPVHQDSIQKRKAVVIACEFGIAESRRNEPLAVCVVDCLTGETLVSALVAATQPMFNWRKDIHGIGLSQMNAATKSGQCLAGWRAAREKLFEYIDSETILVGYGIRLPLELLRFYHTKVVDPQVLVTAAVFPRRIPVFAKGKYKTTLPHVCSEFLRITLRQGLHGKAGIHDRLENALAAREVALQCIQRPAELEAWAQRKRNEFWVANSTANTVYHDTSTSRQTSASPLPSANITAQNVPIQVVPDQDSASTTLNEKYEAGYRAGFESGFRMGYERRLEAHPKSTANTKRNLTSTEKDLLDGAHSKCKSGIEKLISLSDDESETGNRHEIASPRGNDEDDQASTAEIGGLLAELMNDDKIRDMIQRGKLD